MTVQTIFNRAMLYDNQLDLIVGGADVTRGLTALNLVQDWFELVVAAVSNLFRTDQTFFTTAAQDYTIWPPTLLRIDDLFLLDANGNQVRQLDSIDISGAYAPTAPFDVSTGVISQGAPMEYEGQQEGGKIRWSPTPDAIYVIRGYGLWEVGDYGSAGDTFLYPKKVALAFAPHLAQVMRTGLDRDISGQQSAAEAAFKSLITAFRAAVHTGPLSKVYESYHET